METTSDLKTVRLNDIPLDVIKRLVLAAKKGLPQTTVSHRKALQWACMELDRRLTAEAEGEV